MKTSFLFGFVAVLALCFGITLSIKPAPKAHAQSLATTGWTLATEGDYEFRIQNGNTYWDTYTNNVTTASMLEFTEINGKTLSEINAEHPGAITVTLQPAGGTIGSFYRVSINSNILDMNRHDIATVVIRAGWTHTDSSGTYTIDTDLYFAHRQNKASQSDQWKYVPVENVVDISDDISFIDQGIQATNTRAILLKTTGTDYWTASTPNENGGAFLNLYHVNGKSIRDWNKEANAALNAGEITDITYGSGHGTISGNKGVYAPIFVWNADYDAKVGGCYTQTWIPTGYIPNVSSFKVAKGMAWLTDDLTKLYYVSKDVEYVKSGSEFKKVESSVDITDAFKILVQDYTNSNGTMLYYLHTNEVQYWTQQYDSTGAYAINEKEWKGVSDSSLQGGAVQMSYIEFNGTPVYDINATDNGAYGATQGNIASGSKYAPILAFLTPQELGNAIKLQVPSAYPSGSGDAGDNHKTITIKKGFYVLDSSTNIKYEVTRDIQWDYVDGQWVEHVEKIETTVTDAKLFIGKDSTAFAGVQLAGSDYNNAPNTYAGTATTAKSYAQSANFLPYVLIDDKPLATPGEAFLNVWGNYGYFTFRPGNNTATKITILAGCQFPTYNALATGAKEVYVTTEDVTFVKDGSGNWVLQTSSGYTVTFLVDGEDPIVVEVNEDGLWMMDIMPGNPKKAEDEMYTYEFSHWEYEDGTLVDVLDEITSNLTIHAVFTKTLKAGEYNTSISRVTYARDNKNNWMMFRLSDKDYPNAGESYNIPVTEARVSALNLYDKIIVDGYTLRSRIATYGDPVEDPKINLWVDDCFAVRVPGAAGALNGATKVTIRAGAQFPSYKYATDGDEIYYVTTEEVTFVNVGADNGVWERQYKATFVADGEVVETISYLESKGFTAPEVPEKEGYRGVWEAYTANGNITVNAVYTKNPTVLGTTGIIGLRRIDNNSNILIIQPSSSDYPASVDGSWNLGLDVSHLQKFNLLDYVTINGKTLREIGVTEMAINKFTRAGLGLTTTLSDSMTIEIKKGCEIPSYAFWQNPNGEASCYVVDADYTAVYSAGGEDAFAITSAGGNNIPDVFEDHYILSDLSKVGYGKGAFHDGFEVLTHTDGSEGEYKKGYIDSTSFTLSFDFKYDSANYYETFAVMLGTRDLGNGKVSIKTGFGWRFFLLRGEGENISPSQCVQFFSGCDKGYDTHGNFDAPAITGAYFVPGQTYSVVIGYKLLDADTVYTFVSIDGNELAKVQYDLVNAHDTYGTFSAYSPYLNTISFYKENNGATVTVANPGMDMTTLKNSLILNDGSSIPQKIVTDSYVLPELNPAEYGKNGYVFVGWTTNIETYPDLYPAGYKISLQEEGKTLYPVWIKFQMQNGAAVRKGDAKDDRTGIRFLVDIDKPYYEAGKELKYFTELGTILAPTSYLATREFTHQDLGEGYYVQVETTEWNDGDTYSAAFVNLSADQFARAFSARGYIKVQYTTGEGYIYTAYDENEHSRSMYQVATAAINDNKLESDTYYVQQVADITIDSNLNVSKNENAKGGYTIIDSTANGFTISNGAVKTVMINGVRLVMGYDAEIVVGGVIYRVTDFKLSNNGLSVTFDLEPVETNTSLTKIKAQHLAVINGYLNSTAYTKVHKEYIVNYINNNHIVTIINDSETVEDYIETYNTVVEHLASVKTAAELGANNTSEDTLATPTLSKGLGYTVTWTEVDNADYYIVYDDNDYRDGVVVMANADLVYEAEVIGNHNITVTAHSYFEEYNSSTSNLVATPEVKPVFSYKSMLDGLYKFSSTQMSTMGISTTGCYYDSSDKKYFVYYNKDTGWSPDKVDATDWTSPEEFPAHAQRLKDMGNNVILLARDTAGEYKADDTWEASRLRYIMDTAWSMGMKVLVCDEVFYKLSMSDGSDGHATSKAQVTTAINNRQGFADYVTHPAFYGFSLDDEPYDGDDLNAMKYTISALDEACEALGVTDPFYLACLFQSSGSEEVYTGNTLYNYYKDWLSIPGVDNKYLYVDIYTQHAMDYPFYTVTNRYENSFDAVYGNHIGDKANFEFYQAITSHTQNSGTLSEQDLYMSLLYAAAHDVAGYSWFCYFPITGELAGSMVGYDGNGYGNGIGNKASGSYYNAAKTAGYQFELIQGLLDGYDWKTREVSGNLLTTTLSNGTDEATFYVNADEDKMSSSVTVTASGSICYLVGYGVVGVDGAPYQAVSGSVTLQPGQAVICIN